MQIVLRHPARHYIYYLLSRRSMSVKAVVEHLGELRIPLPYNGFELENFIKRLLAVQRTMRVPYGFNPEAATPSADTTAFLSRWKIAGMWRRDEFTTCAIDMVNEPTIRRSAQVMLLGPLAPQLIARRLAARWELPDKKMNARVIREFSHYFWDCSVFDQPQWRKFIWEHFSKFDQSEYGVSLGAPRTREGAQLVLSMSDRGADAMTDSDIYGMMRNSSALCFMQHAVEPPSIQRSQSLLNSILSFKAASEELDKHRGASAELLDELRRMESTYDNNPVTTVHDLPMARHALGPPIEATVVESITTTKKEQSP